MLNVGRRERFKLLKEEILELIFDDFFDDLEEEDIEIINGSNICIKGYIPLKIEEISSYFGMTLDCEIKNSEGEVLGIICFQRFVTDFTEFTEYQKSAYLIDNTKSTFEAGEYFISNNYVVLKKEYFVEYLEKYYNSAPVWGGFCHEQIQSSYQMDIDYVTAREIHLPTVHHQESINRAIKQPYAFERFLKTYHLLELLFDYDLVTEIKNLPEELNGFSNLIKEFNKREELPRLIKVITKRYDKIDFDSLIVKLNSVKHYKMKAKEIFFVHGKDGNPIKSDESRSSLDKFEEIITRDNPFIKDNLKLTLGSVSKEEKYKKFLIELCTYWIYRIRCSIAHYKIGEYLMGYEDEEFIVKFVEPILKQIVLDCFEKQDEYCAI